MSDQQFVLFAGAYDDEESARLDFQGIKDLHKAQWLGPYEGALFVKEANGKIKILDRDSIIRATGATGGAVVGGLIGLIFPPSIVASAAVGGAAGAIIGNLFSGFKRRDIAELGEMLDEGMAGILVIGIPTPELGAQKMLSHAKKVAKKAVDADAKELKKAIDEASL